ncbi:hypothetical protein IMG5_146600 [Ichthyophthirius multifiliis]|uniref:NADP-dependent oxidoreductase domain-containing protein n=1 Tax=Ichthyophthirius multifiliis TaxID=5932 RepID=G0QY18_ICHMU|nr:hypothetical protein IMG5_146600 [Ichthyophthirius multifiliis]EGR29887.1 hypothetical protein IMG5_146600 [Ichthyophthirius multifiliis]|eukprot:XP_004031123.1 hypothetical protein IMG5_146600 [Ichthyophthirius multifiliis]
MEQQHTSLIKYKLVIQKKNEKQQQKKVDESNFKQPYKIDINLSSIGFGTYQGSPTKENDLQMFNALIDSICTGGVNVIDTSINYRYQKSERTIGAALSYLKSQKQIERDQYFLSSKGGFIPEDYDQKINRQDMIKKLNLSQAEIINNQYSLSKNFLSQSIEMSLNNLGIDTLDLFYLQNSSEQILPVLGREKYFLLLQKAFECLEEKIMQKKINSYGLATWISFRCSSYMEKFYLNLEDIVNLAENVGGKNHGFKFIQLPVIQQIQKYLFYLQIKVNLMMPECFAEKYQIIQNEKGEKQEEYLLKVAKQLQINIITSSPLMNGALINTPLSSQVFECANLGAKHLQFIRSIPSDAICSTLIGQKKNRHVKMNLEVLSYPKINEDKFWLNLAPSLREEQEEEIGAY